MGSSKPQKSEHGAAVDLSNDVLGRNRVAPLADPKIATSVLDPAHAQRASLTTDCAKCGNEINQLQNQQFTLATLSIGIVTGYAGLVFGSQHFNEISNLLAGWAGTLIILLLVFHWCLRLRYANTVIAIWLEQAGCSSWEKDIRNFSRNGQNRKIGHMYSAAVWFLCLGIFVTSLSRLKLSGISDQSRFHLQLYAVYALSILYVPWVLLLGLMKYGKREEYAIRAAWTKILGENMGIAPTSPEFSPAQQSADCALGSLIETKVSHEISLLNQRLTLLVLSNSFLFAGSALLYVSGGSSLSSDRVFLLGSISFIGFALVGLFGVSIHAARRCLKALLKAREASEERLRIYLSSQPTLGVNRSDGLKRTILYGDMGSYGIVALLGLLWTGAFAFSVYRWTRP